MQKMFTKILVPVAFSRNTRWLVDKAIQLANKFGCDIFLLHAEAPVSIPFLSTTYLPDLQKRLRKKTERTGIAISA